MFHPLGPKKAARCSQSWRIKQRAQILASQKIRSYALENTKLVAKNPEISGESVDATDAIPPSDLAGLRAFKAIRTPSKVVTARRAAQALASSRMAAKVAQDKLEAQVAPAPLPGDIIDGQRICMVFGGVPLTSINSDELAVGDTVLFQNQLTTVTKIRKPTRARIVVTFALFPEYPSGIRFHRRKQRWAKVVQGWVLKRISAGMAAKVAQDKLEARLAAGRNDVTDDTTARYHQEVAAMRAAAAADRRRGYERTPY